MNKDDYPTEVIFRKYKMSMNGGVEILALFPYSICGRKGTVDCYQHVGQHGEADYQHCMYNLTVPATVQESADLKKELESLGYNLRVMKKRNTDKFIEHYQTFQEQYLT